MAPILTDTHIATVKATAPVLKEYGNAITTVFYDNMIRENPSLNNIFSTTSKVTGRQPRALATAVLAYATYIDDLPKLTHAVQRIAHKHVSLKVTPDQYDIVGRYLMQAIGQVLGEAATPEIVEAWTAAYGVLADVFIGAEGQMYKSNEAENWPASGWRKFKIMRKVPESDSITSFYLSPSDGNVPLPKFLPGQYISLQVSVPKLGYLQSRQYSLSEAPRDKAEYYRISVKREDGEEVGIPGLISNMLHDQYSEGDEVEISHPQGEFSLDPNDVSKKGVPVVLISAGVGATPLMSILGSLVPQEESATKPVTRPVSWIQASRSNLFRPFGSTIKRIVKDNENVTAHIFLRALSPGDKEGEDYHYGDMRLDLAKLDGKRDLHLEDPRTEYYICGPEVFMLEMRRALVKGMGVDLARVYLELFATGDVPAEV